MHKQIEKIKKIQGKPKIIKNLFSKEEIKHCLKSDNPKESFTGIFSVKESIIKASEGNFLDKKSILINYNKFGKPSNEFYDISISHDNGFAVSFAIIKTSATENSKKSTDQNESITEKEINIKPSLNINLLLFLFQLLLILYFVILNYFK